MNPVAVANAATFILTCMLGAAVLIKRPSPGIQAPLLALIGGILIWSGGAVWRAVPVDHEQMMAAHHLVFFGVNCVPMAWLLLALSVTRVETFSARPTLTLALAAPGLLLYLAFVTNPAHGEFAAIRFEAFERGPLFWGMITWAFVCSIWGTAAFLARARWLVSQSERKSAILLVAVGLIPQITAATYLFRVVDWPMDPTPASLGVAAAMLYPLLRGMRTFEALPLLRRDVIEYLPDAVLVSDPDGRIVDLNPAAERLFGDASTLCEATLEEAIEQIAAEQGPMLISRLMQTGESSCPDLGVADGRRFRLRGERVAGEDGAGVGYFLVLHDRSDELAAERALRQAQKLESVGMLAAGVAHEVNNPLSYIRANLAHLDAAAEAAVRLVPAEGEDGKLLGEMPGVLSETRQGIERISSIVSGMKRLSRANDPADETVNLAAVIDEALRVAAIDGSECCVERNLADPLPRVRGSSGELVQVFLNLLINAKQAVTGVAAASIRVSSDVGPQGLRIDVEDSGPGIPDEILERIFDPFFTTKGPGEGTGLGLSIAHDIVRDHGGSVQVDASPLGGARFSLCLPRATNEHR